MTILNTLLDLLSGRPLPVEDTDGQRGRLALLAGAASLLAAGIFGLAAGSTDIGLALGNVVKVPMVLALASMAALPAGLLVWKMAGGGERLSGLLMGVAVGNLTAATILAAAAPIVTLYYHSTAFMGAPITMGILVLAIGCGLANMARGCVHRRGQVALANAMAPVVVLAVLELTALLQLIHVASPILPEVTVFDAGIDGLVMP